VEQYGIAYHEKTHGQLFCDNSSKDILGMLQAECEAANVTVMTHCNVASVRQQQDFVVATGSGDFTAPVLIVATGGLSIPKMGASDFGYRLARQFGLRVRPTRAALVPFTFTGSVHEMTGRLSGVSTQASVQSGAASFVDDILFTHRGISGPAALQASSYWDPGQDLTIDLAPGLELPAELLHAKQTRPQALLRTLLAEQLPKSLVIELQRLFWPARNEQSIVEWPAAELHALANTISSWTVRPAATEGYRTAEVTLGGVDTDQLSSRTMECRQHPGLFFIGEVVDVTGHLGGFNFQWAWASGYAAGVAVGDKNEA